MSDSGELGIGLMLGCAILFGLVIIILMGILVAHRVDDIFVPGTMDNSWRANRERFRRANYDAAGQRILPWFKFAVVMFHLLGIGVMIGWMAGY